MERELPILELGAAGFQVDVKRGLFIDKENPTNRIVVSDLPYLEEKKQFVIFFNPQTRRPVEVEELATGLPKGTKMYSFPSLDRLDPEGFAALHGKQGIIGQPPRVTKAQRLRLPSVMYFPASEVLLKPKFMGDFIRGILRQRSQAAELRKGNSSPGQPR